ncbi:hypothetical protein [Deinococcus sedimenti]|uniref:Uncharacterized protein n=1 Tax=Deinococcus sedimenti TaxID=1867090 RepID=A0ABQ2S7J3_9DEIO|nr:hypothetical protein [Deinococcus sedimenti]GGS05463.1 hypothetical protein GCM10008960_34940 [Deinococcus sedimenti]
MLAIVVTSLIVLNQNTATTLHMALADTRLMLGLLDRAIAIKEEEARAYPVRQLRPCAER